MSLNIALDDNEDITLLDAIAYEFFISHLNDIDMTDEKDEVGVQLAKLAMAGFQVGEIFVLARDTYYEKNNDNDT